MSQLPPQTLSIKRKRNEAPVDALRFDHSNTIKRQRSSQNFAYRRLTRPDDTILPQNVPPTPMGERRFHLTPVGVGAKRVFVEARSATEQTIVTPDTQSLEHPPESLPSAVKSPPRKRPGAGSALRNTQPLQPKPSTAEPSEAQVRELEALSAEISRVDNLQIPLPVSPSKYKPRAPTKRFAERHPEKAAQLAHDEGDDTGDAMDIDNPDDYVYDTYVREPIAPDAPMPTGSIGLLVLGEDDDDWWDAPSNESDKEFDTDDEDENAEDYYANDYPEDELSEDDEFDRNLYKSKYRHGSDDEEYNIDDDDDDAALGSGEDEDDLHYKMTVPKAQRVGYWGTVGQ